MIRPRDQKVMSGKQMLAYEIAKQDSIAMQVRRLAQDLDFLFPVDIGLIILQYTSCERATAFPRFHIPMMLGPRQLDLPRPSGFQLYNTCERCGRSYCHLCFELPFRLCLDCTNYGK